MKIRFLSVNSYNQLPYNEMGSKSFEGEVNLGIGRIEKEEGSSALSLFPISFEARRTVSSGDKLGHFSFLVAMVFA